jgi:hypothetical protein
MGEEPRSQRRFDHSAAFGAHVEAQGVVVAVTDVGCVLDVRIAGVWSVAELDADGWPLNVQSQECEASIALGVEWSDDLVIGESVMAASTVMLQGMTSSVVRQF